MKVLNSADNELDFSLDGMEEKEARMALAALASVEFYFGKVAKAHQRLIETLGRKGKEEEGTRKSTPWINYLIAFTFAVQALMIGTILSTAPFLIYLEYGMPMQNVGYIFAGGETIGTIALMLLVSAENQAAVRKYFPGPFNMLIIIGSLGGVALLLAVQNVGLTVAVITIIMGLNDFGTSLTAEAQGATVAAEDYARVNMLGNVARRVGNMVTAAVGPIMFGVIYFLPFVVFGALTLIWIGFMTYCFHLRGKQVARIMNERTFRSGGTEVAPAGLKLYAKHATFVSAENQISGNLDDVPQPTEETKV
jgi:hypothetical protein